MRAICLAIAAVMPVACDKRPSPLSAEVLAQIRKADGALTDGEVNHLLERYRVVTLRGDIDDNSATVVIAKLLFLESKAPKEPIFLVINSRGGSATAGMAIIQTMQQLKAPVRTVCPWRAEVMAAFVFAAGQKGGRVAGRGCRFVLQEAHVPGGAAALPLHQQDGLRRLKRAMAESLASSTGRAAEELEVSLRSEIRLAAEEAVAFGIADLVMDL